MGLATRYKHEHPIARMLHEAGFKRTLIAKWLGCGEKSLHRWMKDPEKHLTVVHIVSIAGRLGIDSHQVFDIIQGRKPSIVKPWHSETTKDQSEPISQLSPNDKGYKQAIPKPYNINKDQRSVNEP